jgi:folate-dependent phosphoribosylglycinamide formyltransferase PurN
MRMRSPGRRALGGAADAAGRRLALAARPEGALRLVLFGSFWIGQAALQAVLAYLGRFPERAQLVGVVTDDPVSPQARISLRKRAWAAMSAAERLEVKLRLAGTALGAGVPVYTGEIKTAGFRRVLAEWRPDAIVTCGFGQVLDGGILGTAPYGAYNCHPTDLANGHGAGPAPWDDMAARGVTHTVWSVHRMTEVVDAGPVVGQTPPINVADAQGRLIPDPRAFFFKVLPPIGWMVMRTVDALVRRRAMGLREPLRHVELDAAMPPALRRRLLQPLAPDWRGTPIPTPGEEEFEALRSEAASRQPHAALVES